MPYFPVFVIISVYFLYVALFSAYHFRLPRWEVVIVGLALVSQAALTELKFGPASLRIYLLTPLFLYSLIRIGNLRLNPKHFMLFTSFIIFCLVFFLWTVVAESANGDGLKPGRGVLSYGLAFVAKRFVPLFFLITIVVFVQRRHDLKFLGFLLVSIIASSSLLGVLQFFNFGPAQRFHKMTHPMTYMRYELKEVFFGESITIDQLSIAGLDHYSIPFSYSLITLGPLALAYALVSQNKNVLSRGFMLGIYMLSAVCVYLARSRSGIIATGFSVTIVFFLAPRVFREVRFSRFVMLAVLGVLLICISLVVIGSMETVTLKYTDFNRMGDYSDVHRIETAVKALSEIGRYPVFGIGIGEFSRRHPTVPHNAILNAGVYFGIPGVIFCLGSYLLVGWFLWHCLKKRSVQSTSWIGFGALMGIVSYEWNGLTHNSSFVTGGVWLLIMMGLLLCSLSIEAADLQIERRAKISNWFRLWQEMPPQTVQQT